MLFISLLFHLVLEIHGASYSGFKGFVSIMLVWGAFDAVGLGYKCSIKYAITLTRRKKKQIHTQRNTTFILYKPRKCSIFVVVDVLKGMMDWR